MITAVIFCIKIDYKGYKRHCNPLTQIKEKASPTIKREREALLAQNIDLANPAAYTSSHESE
ncbi:MAG: hypothetical protein DRG76_00820 [Deltaproteobacteria bacterium]|nr:MAG: hypothetical protein DRG76_00820 [Deltaproteobacteria bacterium]